MVAVRAYYDGETDKIKSELVFDDEEDGKLIMKETEALVACIARFYASASDGEHTPIEFLRGIIADIEDDCDLYADGLNGE